MNIDEVLELLEIDSPDEFEYFEHFAELMECAEEITYEAFYAVLKEVDSDTLNELLDSYFDDILQGIADDASDFYTLMTLIRQCLMGLAAGISSHDSRRLFVDELFRFRTWYTFDSLVHCKSKSDGLTSDLPVVEALALYRLEKLGEEKYEYDFSECLDYPLEEYVMPFPYSMKDEDNEEDDEIEDEFTDTFIDKDFPVIDGEYSDDYE